MDGSPVGIAARVVTRVLDLAFPASCVGCGREGAAFCPACSPALDARVDLPAGVPIGLPVDLPDPLLQVEWCAAFAGIVRDALHQLKYAGERRVADPMGAAMARRWTNAGAGGEILVPVPVHRDRAAQRGYDQAELLASSAARHLGLPMHAALERWQATTAQFELDRRARASNVAGAFRVRSPLATDPVRGRWVILVDDVMTTGATLSACASALLDGGATAVSAITVARER
jgi:ComF family protein